MKLRLFTALCLDQITFNFTIKCFNAYIVKDN